jgi:hypothetical protein
MITWLRSLKAIASEQIVILYSSLLNVFCKLNFNHNQMRKLSVWAKYHPMTARVVIIFSRITLIILGVTLAKALFISGIKLPAAFLFCSMMIFFFTCIFYPGTQRGFTKNYLRRKSFDLAVAISAFIMLVSASNQLYSSNLVVANNVAASPLIKEPGYKNAQAKKLIDAYYSGEKKSFTRKEKKLLKAEFVYQLKQYGGAVIKGEKQQADATGTIILAILGAGLLLYLVAALACSLSCNGSDAAAIAVALLGTAGVILLLVLVIKGAKRKAKEKNPPPPPMEEHKKA